MLSDHIYSTKLMTQTSCEVGRVILRIYRCDLNNEKAEAAEFMFPAVQRRP